MHIAVHDDDLSGQVNVSPLFRFVTPKRMHTFFKPLRYLVSESGRNFIFRRKR